MTNRWTVLAVLCASLLLVAVDTTVLHTVAPVISRVLRPSATQLLWIVDVYGLVAAPLLLTFGTLGDRYGRRRVLLYGYVVFGVASVLASTAPNAAMLIAARALLGLGGAMIMPTTLSMIRQVFPDPAERATAIATWSATASFGAIVGPLLGGTLVEHFWWGSVFLINVPIMLLAVPLGRWLLPETRDVAGGRWDATGAALAGGGVLSLAFAIKEAGRGEPVLGAVVGVASLLLLIVFVLRQLRLVHPLLEIRLFTVPAFASGVSTVLVALAAMVGLELYFAQYLQLVLGNSPLFAAVRMLPIAVASIVGSLLGAPLVRRFGALATASGGLFVAAASILSLLFLTVTDRPWLLGAGLAGIGTGLAVSLTAATNALMGSSRADQGGQVAALEETSYELGGSLGVAVLGSVMVAGYRAHFPAPAGMSPEVREQAARSLPDAYDTAEGLAPATAAELNELARSTFVSSLHLTLLVAGCLLVAVAASIAVVQRRFRHADVRPSFTEST